MSVPGKFVDYWVPPQPQGPESSAVGTLARRAGEAAAPTAAFAVGAAPGARVGSIIGGALPLAFGQPELIPAGEWLGGLVGGTITGLPASIGTEYVQHKALDAAPGFRDAIGLSPEQRAADEEQHPWASRVGSALPLFATARPSISAFTTREGLGKAAANSIGFAGMDAAQQAILNDEDTPIDWSRVGESAVLGALANKETGIGRSLRETGERVLPQAWRTPVPTTPPPPAQPDPNASPQMDLFSGNQPPAPVPPPDQTYQTRGGNTVTVPSALPSTEPTISLESPKGTIPSAANPQALADRPLREDASNSLSGDYLYVRPEHLESLYGDNKVFDLGGSNEPFRLVPVGDNRLGVQYTSGERAGRVDPERVVPTTTTPEAGLVPLRISEGGDAFDIGRPMTQGEVQTHLEGRARREGGTAPEAEPTPQTDMFAQTPSASLVTDFTAPKILSRILNYGKQLVGDKGLNMAPIRSRKDGDSPAPAVGISQVLARILSVKDGGRAAKEFIQRRLDDLQKASQDLAEKHEIGLIQDKFYAIRNKHIQRELEAAIAADSVVDEFVGQMQNALRGEVTNLAEAGKARAKSGEAFDNTETPGNVTEQQMRESNAAKTAAETEQAEKDAAEAARQKQEEEDRAQHEKDVAELKSLVATRDQMTKRSDNLVQQGNERRAAETRQRILEGILADPETRNPISRFTAALRKAGIRDLALTDAESKMLAAHEEKRAADEIAAAQADEQRAEEVGVLEAQIKEKRPKQTQASAPIEPAKPVSKNAGGGNDFRLEMQRTPTAEDEAAIAAAQARRERRQGVTPEGETPTAPKGAAPNTVNRPQGELFKPSGEPYKGAAGETRRQLIDQAQRLLDEVRGEKGRSIVKYAMDAFLRKRIDFDQFKRVQELVKARRYKTAYDLTEELAPRAKFKPKRMSAGREGGKEPPAPPKDEPPPPPPPPPNSEQRKPRRSRKDAKPNENNEPPKDEAPEYIEHADDSPPEVTGATVADGLKALQRARKEAKTMGGGALTDLFIRGAEAGVRQKPPIKAKEWAQLSQKLREAYNEGVRSVHGHVRDVVEERLGKPGDSKPDHLETLREVIRELYMGGDGPMDVGQRNFLLKNLSSDKPNLDMVMTNIRAAIERAERAGLAVSGAREGMAKVDPKGDTRLSQNRERSRGGASADSVRTVVSETLKKWKNPPGTEVVQSVKDLPVSAPSNTDGMYHQGKLYLVADNIYSAGHAKAVLFHEGLGHFGLKGRFGRELAGIIRDAYNSNEGFRKAVEQWKRDNLNTQEGREFYSQFSEEKLQEIAGEEVLAQQSEHGPAHYDFANGPMYRIAAAIRNFGRSMGLEVKYTSEDIYHILHQAHKYTMGGGKMSASDDTNLSQIGNKGIRNLGKQRDLDTARVMAKTGADMEAVRKSTLFHRGEDGKWRLEISDKGSTINDATYQKMLPGTNLINKRLQPAARSGKAIYTLDNSLNRVLLPKSEYKADTTVGELLDHPELYKAYPGLKDLPVVFTRKGKTGNGVFIPLKGADRIGIEGFPSKEVLRSTLLHELQHAIQGTELFDQGGGLPDREHLRYELSNAVEDAISRAVGGYEMQSSDIATGEGALGAFEKLSKALKSGAYRTLEDVPKWSFLKLAGDPRTRAELSKSVDDILDILHSTAKTIREKEAAQEEKLSNPDFNSSENIAAYEKAQDEVHRWFDSDREKLVLNAVDKIDAIIHEKKNIAQKIAGEFSKDFHIDGKLRYMMYQMLRGEVEARDTQHRMDMSEKELAATPLFSGDNISNKQELSYNNQPNSLFSDAMANYARERPSDDTMLSRNRERETPKTSLAEGVTHVDVDGVQRSALNSEGKPIHWSEEGTRNFWRWFSDSVMVDNQGRPQVVYHGTNRDFAEFKTKGSKYLNGLETAGGIYLTTDRKMASWAAENLPERKGQSSDGANVMPLYASIKKPYFTKSLSAYPSKLSMATLKLRGYDGIVHSPDGTIKNAVEILALKSEQVKSAIGNDGSYEGTRLSRNRDENGDMPSMPYERAKRLSEDLENSYLNGKMPFDEYVNRIEPLRKITRPVEWQKRVDETRGKPIPVFQDIMHIPEGTRLTVRKRYTHDGSTETAKVVGTHVLQVKGFGVTRAPVVEFADGKTRRLNPSDIVEAHMPRAVKAASDSDTMLSRTRITEDMAYIRPENGQDVEESPARAAFKKVSADDDIALDNPDLIGATMITGIDAKVPSSGAGSKLLADINSWADKNGKTLVVVPARASLKDWYERNGFVSEADYMIRQPSDTMLSRNMTTNADGEPIFRTKEGTENFRRWFGDSKMVDKRNRPLVLYHGGFDLTNKPLGEGVPKSSVRGKLGQGFYLTPNNDLANFFGKDGAVIRYYARLNNPLEITRKWTPSVADVADELGIDIRSMRAEDVNNGTLSRMVTEAAQKQGYDGVVYRDAKGNIKEVVAYDPTSVKSIDHNNGDFSPFDGDVRLSRSTAPMVGGDSLESRLSAMNDPENMRRTPLDWWTNTKGKARRGVLKIMDQRWIADTWRKDLPQIDRWVDNLQTKSAYKSALIQRGSDTFDKWNALPDTESKKIEELLLDASEQEVNVTSGSGALQSRFKQLTPQAQQVYREVRSLYEDHFNTARKLMESFIQKDETLSTEEKEAAIKQMSAQFRHTEGYFPFMRFGDFVTISESKQYAAQRKAIEALEARLETVISDRVRRRLAEEMRTAQKTLQDLAEKGERIVTAHETEADMANHAQAMRQQGMDVREKLAADYDGAADGVSSTFMKRVNDSLDSMANRNPDDRSGILGMKTMLNQLYFQMMPEGSALKRQLMRRGVAGFSRDAKRVFAASATRNAGYLAELKHGVVARQVLEEMRQSLPGKPIQVQEVYNQLKNHYNALHNYSRTPIQDVLNQTTYAYMLGASPSFMAMHLLQTPMITAPLLAGKHGWGKVAAALGKAGAQVAGNYSKGKTPGTEHLLGADAGEQNMIKYMLARNAINGTEADMFRGAAKGNDGAGKLGRQIMHAASYLPHHTEKFNRLTTALAAYRLAMTDPAIARSVTDAEFAQHQKDHPELKLTKQQYAASKYAERITLDSHVDYSRENAAYVMQPGTMGGLPTKLMFQFQKYQFGMLKVLTQSYGAMMDASLPAAERKAGMRSFLGILGTHAVITGMMGLPGFGLGVFIKNMWDKFAGDPDVPHDAESEFRNMITQSLGRDAGDVVSRGILYAPGLRNVLPIDITNRVGLGDLVVSGGRVENIDRNNLMAYLGSVAGGPSMSLLGNLADAYRFQHQGEFWRAGEMLLPKVLRDISRARRYYEEGVTTASGKPVMLSPNEGSFAGGGGTGQWDDESTLNMGDVYAQMSGFEPQRVHGAYERRMAFQDAQTDLQDRRKVLLKQYAEAYIDRDYEAVRKFSEKIREYNAKQREVRAYSELLTPASMKRAIVQRVMERRRLQGGISPRMREMGLAESIGALPED